MSGFAELLHDAGFTVKGSDAILRGGSIVWSKKQ